MSIGGVGQALGSAGVLQLAAGSVTFQCPFEHAAPVRQAGRTSSP
jgi:hypothetical protein